jgi:hypothetical protein
MESRTYFERTNKKLDINFNVLKSIYKLFTATIVVESLIELNKLKNYIIK